MPRAAVSMGVRKRYFRCQRALLAGRGILLPRLFCVFPHSFQGKQRLLAIGPLQDPVTWYGINYAGTQIEKWDFQNKGKSGWTGKSSRVLEVPLRHLRPGVIYSIPCDWILQRAYLQEKRSLHDTGYYKPRMVNIFVIYSLVILAF